MRPHPPSPFLVFKLAPNQSYIHAVYISHGKEVSRFVSDSHQTGVNNHISYSISSNLDHFIVKTKPCKVTIIGINGKNQVPGIHTVCWYIGDDTHSPNPVIFQKTMHVLAYLLLLISPLHSDQCVSGHFPEIEVIWCATCSKIVVRHWLQRSKKWLLSISNTNKTPIL